MMYTPQLTYIDHLKNSIYHLDPDLVSTIIKSNTIYDLSENILEWMLDQLLSGSCCKEDTHTHTHRHTLKCISWYTTNLLLGTNFLRILDIISSNYPLLITDEIIKYVNFRSATCIEIIDILNKYKIENDNEKYCFICSLSYTDQLINPPCLCKNLIHLRCTSTTID